MLRFIYVVLGAGLLVLLDLLFAVVGFAILSQLIGPLGGAAFVLLVLASGAIGLVQFIAFEGFDRLVFSWFPLGRGYDASFTANFLSVLIGWAVVGFFVYKGMNGGN